MAYRRSPAKPPSQLPAPQYPSAPSDRRRPAHPCPGHQHRHHRQRQRRRGRRHRLKRLPLSAGEALILDHIDNLASVRIDSAVNGEGVSWLKLDA